MTEYLKRQSIKNQERFLTFRRMARRDTQPIYSAKVYGSGLPSVLR